MQKISKNHGFQVEFTSLSPKNHQKNQQDFSPFPWSGRLVDPFDPTVLRPQAKGLPFRNNESLQHSYLSKENACRAEISPGQIQTKIELLGLVVGS